jgi:hypothetical protein
MLSHYKSFITLDNVNCIPPEFNPPPPSPDPDYGFTYNLALFKKQNSSFLRLILSEYDLDSLQWLLNQFSATQLHLNDETKVFNHQNETPLLYCARYCPEAIPLLIKAGARNGGRAAFNHLAASIPPKVIRTCSLPNSIFKSLFKAGLGNCAYARGPTYLADMAQKYRWRSNRCRSIVTLLLGVIRFRSPTIFKGIDKRLLRQMLVFNLIWTSRYRKYWDLPSSLVKKSY